MNFYSVDRIVEGIAVIEQPDKSLIEVSIKDLPEGIKEGDILIKIDEGFCLDSEATQKRKKALFNLQKSLFENRD